MNKRFTRKIFAAFAVATFFTGVMFAQVEATGDYTQYDANLTAPTTIDYVTLRTGGSTVMGYYAVPDPVYHPAYVNGPVGPWTLTADFTWDWTIPTNPGAGASVSGGGAPANYVEITFTATGVYEVNVAETAPAAFGGCADQTPTVLDVTVIAPPTATMATNPTVGPADWQVITANVSHQRCGDQAAEPVTVSFVENIPNALASYAFQITETIELIDGSNNVIVAAANQAETVIEDWALTSKLQGANLDGNGDATTLPGAAFATATPNFTFTFNTDALNVLQTDAAVDARTRYTYTVNRTGTAAFPAANNDLASNISHKSDYVNGTVLYYGFTNSTVSFIVNPEPATGPIYHISNTLRF